MGGIERKGAVGICFPLKQEPVGVVDCHLRIGKWKISFIDNLQNDALPDVDGDVPGPAFIFFQKINEIVELAIIVRESRFQARARLRVHPPFALDDAGAVVGLLF